MVRGPSPGPAPACQARASNSRLPGNRVDGRGPTGSCASEGAQGGWRLHRAAQGAGRSPRCATHRRRQCSRPQPGRQVDATSVIILSLVFARPGMHRPGRVRCRTSSGKAEVAAPGWPEGAARIHWPPTFIIHRRSSKVIWIRSRGWLRHLMAASIWVLLFQASVFCYKTIIPEAQEHLLAASGR